jgi:asparagine synthase (glutamine-hydrolysing)
LTSETEFVNQGCAIVQKPLPHWGKRTLSSLEIYFAGDYPFSKRDEKNWIIEKTNEISHERLIQSLKTHPGPFALILATPRQTLGVVDHIRSFPLYFHQKLGSFFIGNDARKVRDAVGLREANNSAVAEFLLSGYAHGRKTLMQSVSQLSPGELIIFDHLLGTAGITSYFKYDSHTCIDNHAPRLMIQQFGDILDNTFKRLRENIGDRQVLLPLSGGLDSRLVLTKLLEHGVSNIQTFTYGVAGNHEMVMAKKISAHLNVKWKPIVSNIRHLQNLYNHTDRSRYAAYADGLNSVPVYLDYEFINHLAKNKYYDSDSIIVNGYSGDFLFGGHIPEELALFPSSELLIRKLMAKHCSQFDTPALRPAWRKIQKDLVDRFLPNRVEQTPEQLCSLYEQWDWKERQTKAVVNGVRLYEYYGFNWALPLWDRQLVSFWSTVPLQFKLNQRMHIQYLKQYNYRGAFDTLRSVNEIWPLSMRWLTTGSRIIELVLGEKGKDRFLSDAFYFSYFRNQLGFVGRQKYREYCSTTRRPHVVPLLALKHLEELGIPTAQFFDAP